VGSPQEPTPALRHVEGMSNEALHTIEEDELERTAGGCWPDGRTDSPFPFPFPGPTFPDPENPFGSTSPW
jgi:hypothetical protein